MSAPRFILYSHDGCGLGHLRRNLAIAAANLLSVAASYGVWALPSTFIIDRQGNRAHFATPNALEQELQSERCLA